VFKYQRPRILLVDDDIELLDALRRQIGRKFDVTATTDPKEAVRLVFADEPFAVIVSDLRMPVIDGVSLLFLIRQAAPDTVRVLLTGHADIESAISAINQGSVFRFLTKPCPTAQFVEAIEAAVEHYLQTKADGGK
jgi:DNA-binding NtrC family response regulator